LAKGKKVLWRPVEIKVDNMIVDRETMCVIPEDDINSATLVMQLHVCCVYFILGQGKYMLKKCDIVVILLTLFSLLQESTFSTKEIPFKK
jgi:hypothetical protein